MQTAPQPCPWCLHWLRLELLVLVSFLCPGHWWLVPELSGQCQGLRLHWLPEPLVYCLALAWGCWCFLFRCLAIGRWCLPRVFSVIPNSVQPRGAYPKSFSNIGRRLHPSQRNNLLDLCLRKLFCLGHGIYTGFGECPGFPSLLLQ